MKANRASAARSAARGDRPLRSCESPSGSRTNRTATIADLNYLRQRVVPLAARYPRWREPCARGGTAQADADANRMLRAFLKERGLRARRTKLAEMLRQSRMRSAEQKVRIAHDGKELRMYRGKVIVKSATDLPCAREVVGRIASSLASTGWSVDLQEGARQGNRLSETGRQGDDGPSSFWRRAPAARRATSPANTEESVSGIRNSALGTHPAAATFLRQRAGLGAGAGRGCALPGAARIERRRAALGKIGTYPLFCSKPLFLCRRARRGAILPGYSVTALENCNAR